MRSDDALVIVGAGHAGFQLAASLRQSGYQEQISLINNEPHLPYQRPPLSKEFLKGGGDAQDVLFRPETFFKDHRIDMLNDHVAQVDRHAREIRLRAGGSLRFRHLVLATGARNRLLKMPNAEHESVLYLRSLTDSEAIRQRLEQAKQVVVIGAGFIGLEFAATAVAKGLKVDVVELAPRIMARAISPEVSSYYQSRHEAAGCGIHCARSVSAIEVGNGRLQCVVLDDGQRLAADLIVVGIGVVPNVELAIEAGLPSREGILVDQYLSTADPNISAIGDCALFSTPRRTSPVRIEAVSNAVDQAKCLAATLTGDKKSFDSVPWFWSDQGNDKLQIVGLVENSDQRVLRGAPDKNAFSVFCYREGVLLGVESVNRAGDHMAARRLLAAGGTVCPTDAASLSFDLRSALSSRVGVS